MPIPRRSLLKSSAAGLLGIAGCAAPPREFLPPIRAATDRIFDITVCLRPFRAAGPRIEAERIGDAMIVHNYGHGGSGWSLSWGSSTLAVEMAMSTGARDVAVLGCGALGLTSAILAQRAGARVTIYAREFLPQTRSARATGSWTPDSRIALTHTANPAFPAIWERMARISFKTYRQYLGLPGDPVEWADRYTLSQTSLDGPRPRAHGTLDFVRYEDRISDLTPRPDILPADATQFDIPYIYRSEAMTFNIASYGHTLLTDFLLAGGTLRHAEFFAPAELAALAEKVVINCPGYGARALWRDETITPVRGQIAWLIPQPELHYGLYYNDVNVLSRRDGVVVQSFRSGDMEGYGDANETPDRAEAEQAVATVAQLFEEQGRRRVLF